jgi:hypothetical protein
MEVINVDSELADLLRRYDDDCGSLQFVLISLGGDKFADDEHRHREAALLAIRYVQQQVDDEATSLVHRYGGTREDYFHFSVPAGFAPQGKQISVDEFIGPLYSRSEGFQRRAPNGLYGDEMRGFAYALMEPPHGLGNGKELFSEFKLRLFANFPDDTIVYEWETDELGYFEAGREWWGTFYWTVEVPAANRIVGILGSTTD